MSESVLKAGGRGSVWRRWEPHIHAPGYGVGRQVPQDKTAGSSTSMPSKAASPALQAIGVTDYYITRSYERMFEEKAKGRLQECDLLFPNIELRLNTGTVKGNFVNIHLLVSPEDPNHVDELNRFLGRLWFSAFDDKFVMYTLRAGAAGKARARWRYQRRSCAETWRHAVQGITRQSTRTRTAASTGLRKTSLSRSPETLMALRV